MRIVLANPPRVDPSLYTLRDEICFQNVAYVPFPLRLARAAAVLGTVPGVTLRAVDANALDMDIEAMAPQLADADLLVFQSAPGLVDRDVEVAREFRRANPDGRAVILESVVAPLFPERFLSDFPEVDVVVRGEPEAVLPEIVRHLDDLSPVAGVAFRNGDDVVVNDPPDEIWSMEDVPPVPYDLFPLDRYTIGIMDAPMHERRLPGVRVRTTKDCPYGCQFCIIGSTPLRGYHGRWRAQPAEAVLDELERLARDFGVRGVYFWDETFTLDQDRAAEIAEGMIARNLGLTWRCLTRIDCVSADLLRLLARAGLAMVEFGIEAGDPAARRELGKSFTDAEAIRAVRWARRAGIRTNCDVIVGMPFEDERTLARTAALAKRLGADNIHITMAFPYPGTKFHETATAEGLLEVDDLYDLIVHTRVRVGARPVARTRSLSVDELQSAWRRVRTDVDRHYFVQNVIRRPWTMAPALRSIRNPLRAASGLLTLARKALGR